MSQTSQEIEEALRSKMLAVVFDRRHLNHQLMVSIAQELAMDILTVEVICRNHCITRDDLDAMLRTENFAQLYREAQVAWGSSSAASLRIKAKMESMVELALPSLFEELSKDGLTTAKVELVKAMMRGGGIGEKAGGVGGEAGVTIQINMGSAKETRSVTIEGTALSREAEDA